MEFMQIMEFAKIYHNIFQGEKRYFIFTEQELNEKET